MRADDLGAEGFKVQFGQKLPVVTTKCDDGDGLFGSEVLASG